MASSPDGSQRKLGSAMAGLANWATSEGNGLTRPIMESALKIDRHAHLPPFMETPLVNKGPAIIPAPNPDGPAFGRKVVIYAGCTTISTTVLRRGGDEVLRTRPHRADRASRLLRHAQARERDLAAVASRPSESQRFFAPLIEEGWDIVPLTTSCALMLKFEWPLIGPAIRRWRCWRSTPSMFRNMSCGWPRRSG